jgi:hypothetical protein
MVQVTNVEFAVMLSPPARTYLAGIMNLIVIKRRHVNRYYKLIFYIYQIRRFNYVSLKVVKNNLHALTILPDQVHAELKTPAVLMIH